MTRHSSRGMYTSVNEYSLPKKTKSETSGRRENWRNVDVDVEWRLVARSPSYSPIAYLSLPGLYKSILEPVRELFLFLLRSNLTLHCRQLYNTPRLVLSTISTSASSYSNIGDISGCLHPDEAVPNVHCCPLYSQVQASRNE